MEIKGYRIEKVIGRGGMATVYLAVQTTLQRHVALKVMNPAFANDEEFTTRFLQEGPIAAKLSDPQIVTVYDSGVDEKHYYLAMEYLPGGTLKQRIREGLPIEKALNIIKLLAKGLAYAHSQQVLHRDIKPQNILFRNTGEPVLTDFGIAKALTGTAHLTVPGTAFGSPKYMSPEQAKGNSLDHRSDIYSMGIVFYEMLTGAPPFQGKEAVKLAQAHITESIPPLPVELSVFQPLVDGLLAKDPDERFQSIDLFLTGLKEARHRYELDIADNTSAADDVTQVRMPVHTAKPDKVVPPKQRSNLPKLLTGVAVLAIAVIGGAFIYNNYGTPGSQNSVNNEQVAVTNALEQEQQQPVVSELTEQETAAANANARLAEVLNQARSLRQQGQLEQSLALVEEHLADQPDQSDLLALQQELQNTITELDNRQQVAAYLASARKALQQDDLQASTEAIEQGLALMPDDNDLRYLRTRVEARARQIAQEQAAERQRQAQTEQVQQLYQQAQEQLQQEQIDPALATLEEAFGLVPEGESQLNEQLSALRSEIEAMQAEIERKRQLEAEINQQLAQAEQQIERLQLTTPAGNNAYDTYQKILAQDPDNQQAQAGLSAIAAKYAELAEQAFTADDSEKAEAYIQRGLEIQSDHPKLIAVQTALQSQQSVQNALRQARQLLQNGQLEDSLAAIDEGLQTEADNSALQALRSEVLQALDQREKELIAQTALTEARQLADNQQWDDALNVLEKALAEAPDNEALSELQSELKAEQEQQIVSQYLAEAEAMLDNDDFSAAFATVQQRLQEIPDNPDLQALKTRIQRQQTVQTVLKNARELADAGSPDISLTLIERGLDIAPDHPELRALQAELVAAVQASTNIDSNDPETEDTATENPADTDPDLENLGSGLAQLVQQMGLENARNFLRERIQNLSEQSGQQAADAESPASIEPDDTELARAEQPEELPAEQADSSSSEEDNDTARINELLATAEARFAKLNLTTPAGQSAFDAYQDILKIDPDNALAKRGLQNIVNRYQGWAQSQLSRGNFQRSLGNIDKALRVDPDNNELLALRKTVLSEQRQAASSRRSSSSSTGRSTQRNSNDPCAVDRRSKECWCKTLKMFCD